jgi:hypothetical protein
MTTAQFKLLMEHSVTTVVVVGSVFLIGWDLLKSMRRKGRYRMAFHGHFVWYWMLLGSLTGMVLAAFTGDPRSASGPFLGLCLLSTWALGMVHGLVMLPFFRPPVPPSHDPDAD